MDDDQKQPASRGQELIREMSARAFKEKLWPCGARIFEFWRGFGEGAGLKDPVTEPKRGQNSKRPLLS
ncbi:MAG: hypothetical protein ABSF34_21515, partial [Verrucomicrobiota bacterium]